MGVPFILLVMVPSSIWIACFEKPNDQNSLNAGSNCHRSAWTAADNADSSNSDHTLLLLNSVRGELGYGSSGALKVTAKKGNLVTGGDMERVLNTNLYEEDLLLKLAWRKGLKVCDGVNPVICYRRKLNSSHCKKKLSYCEGELLVEYRKFELLSIYFILNDHAKTVAQYLWFSMYKLLSFYSHLIYKLMAYMAVEKLFFDIELPKRWHKKVQTGYCWRVFFLPPAFV